MYLLDSDECISLLNGYRRAQERIAPLRSEGLAISIVSYAEIYEGIYGSDDQAAAEQTFSDFLREVTILPVTLAVARRFAAIRRQLRRAGNLILDMDLLIAATAIEHDLTLVTGNRRHFERVPGIKLHTPTN